MASGLTHVVFSNKVYVCIMRYVNKYFPDTHEEITDIVASGLTHVVFSNKVYVCIMRYVNKYFIILRI